MTATMFPSPILASAGADLAWLLAPSPFGILLSKDLKSASASVAVESKAEPGTWFFKKFKYASYLWAESVQPAGHCVWQACGFRLAGLQPVTALCAEASLARS